MKIELKDVSKFYGKKQALNHINLTIEQGMFGLLGKNGAGKTTLMKTLATLLKAEEGSIVVCGVPIQEEMKIREMTGYLPQDFSMYGKMKVYEALDYLGVLSGLDKATRKERIPKLLAQVNLENHATMKIKAMSGGMRRRLGIAQALLNEPKVLIVDEPTAGLDPEERIRFRNLLCDVATDKIVILSTHIVGDIEATCENLAIMEEGKIKYQGTVTEMVEKANGHIYEAEISRLELDELKKDHMVTGMVSKGSNVEVRFIAKETTTFLGAVKIEPSVEDAYMYLVQEMRGEC